MLVGTNSVIQSVKLLHRRHWSTWITVWPFVILYAIQISLYMNPELVWDRITYLVYQQYIDFFHATCFPLLFFGHAFLVLFTVWSVNFRAKVLFSELTVMNIHNATHVAVITHPHKGEPALELCQHKRPTSPGAAAEHFFIFQQRKWKFNANTLLFEKPKFPTKETFAAYKEAAGLAAVSVRESQLDKYGLNDLVVDVPEFTNLFVDHALAPFFVFQMFCVLLWCLDEYWMYSVFTGIMMVVMECTVVFQRIRNMKTLRQMGEVPSTKLYAFRKGRDKAPELVDSRQLLPLDVIVVPCNAPCPVDAVIIQGTCVVNEATLTGESTPQMKEALDECSSTLEMKKHARHILFSGTEILLSSGKTVLPVYSSRGLALAVVVKTGFETKQGKLLRTILHSQSRISENSGEAFAFIGALVVFALAASGYLLKRGLEDPNRSRWKLFLWCTQIITAVVPPELPMELSLAVNASLLQLMKLRVFCTEPFRIPFAGKVDTCCFDKTGTLTTDEMLYVGADACNGDGLCGRSSMNSMAELVLASCHTLVNLEGTGLAGDAMEKAALTALHYTLTKEDTITYTPPPPPAATPGSLSKGSGHRHDHFSTISIMARHPFIASLRRMCVIVSVDGGKYIVAKGSPDAIMHICRSVPSGYTDACDRYASKGRRVIALAYRQLSGDETTKAAIANMSREECEQNLVFAGFAVFDCPLKKDAHATIVNLQAGSHQCVTITGDSVQTAIAVGKQVGMVESTAQLITTADEKGQLSWIDPHTHKTVTGTVEEIRSKTFIRSRKAPLPADGQWDLCVNAECLTSAVFEKVVADYGDVVTIWARCAPSQKEDIVTDLKRRGRIVLMAGDGTNDVGALKQADVGIAVLNAASVNANNNAAGTLAATAASTASGAAHPDAKDKDVPPGLTFPPNFRLTAVPPPLRADASFWDRTKYEVSVAKRKAEILQITKWNQQNKLQQDKRSALMPKAPKNDDPMDAEALMSSLFNSDEGEDGMGGVPIIKLGDASIAAPFTCKSKALLSICDVVRMGRSTLVTTLQMYKILALNCLASAYSMSVLHSDGVKLGDKQMLVSGVIVTICFLCMSRSQPLDKLSPQRPITRVFHPYMVCSILGQFALHLFTLVTAVQLVSHVDAEAVIAQRGEGDDATFKPTLLNSVVFLTTTLMTATTFFVNYRGEPFMQSIRQNRPMFYALIALVGLVFFLATETSPEINEELQIVQFPSDDFRNSFVNMLLVDMVGAYGIEIVCLRLMTDY